jgi:protein phosphatase 1 regulatory subunit 37
LDTLAGAQELQAQLERIMQGDKVEFPTTPSEELALVNRAKATLPALVAAIEASNDPTKLEEMLLLNDSLTELVKKIETTKPLRPSLSLNGLSNGSATHSEITESTPGTPFSAGVRSPTLNSLNSFSSLSSLASPRTINADEDDIPVTPKLDKGKGKAVIHDEPLSFSIGSDEEDGKIIPEPRGAAAADEAIGSPTDSRYILIPM